jgi:hypothetical protein
MAGRVQSLNGDTLANLKGLPVRRSLRSGFTVLSADDGNVFVNCQNFGVATSMVPMAVADSISDISSSKCEFS